MTPHGRKGGHGLAASELPAPCTHPWDLQPGEPPLWYARFQNFLKLGPFRTLAATGRAEQQQKGVPPSDLGADWFRYARVWNWQARAAAWDAAMRKQQLAEEQAARHAVRERRLRMLDQAIEATYGVLAQANLPSLTEEQARAMLPTTRLMFRDLFAIEDRQLYALPVADKLEVADAATLCADDLRQIQLQLEAWRAGEEAESVPPISAPPGRSSQAAPAFKQTLLVCVGPDAALMVDVAALRAVKAATGLNFHRILNVTRNDFEAYLRRERSKGRPVELVHMAVHASHEGVHFADGMVEGDWLSERLLGVRVMLLAGCEGDRVGDWLGVVPHVVTLAEEITHDDAATLTQHFWSAIGRGLEPDAALDDALAHCPPVVAEYVIRHW